jgi:hypothetical protein
MLPSIKNIQRALAVAIPSALLVVAMPVTAFAQEAPDTAADRKKQEAAPLPLVASRTIELDTDEGTWISLDVSPDGRSVIFEMLGDLYTVPLGGGDATRITEGLAYDTQPRYSPDGTKVAFISDRSGGGDEREWVQLDVAGLDTGR